MGNPGWGYIEDQYSMAALLPFMFTELKIDRIAIMVDMADAEACIVTMAILLGAYGVRVGMEDALCIPPGREDYFQQAGCGKGDTIAI